MLTKSALIRALAVLFLFISVSFGQSQRGTITGTVTDKSGAVIPNAKVVVTATATNTTSTMDSGEAGQFTVTNLSPGDYSIRVEKDGFKPSLTKGLAIDAGATVREDVSLEVGTSVQTIEITA